MSEGTTVMAEGRIVWTSGDLFKGAPSLDQNTKQQRFNKAGEPLRQYGFGLAIPKSALTNDPNNIWAAIHKEALAIYPSGQFPPGFAWKYKDGDTGIDHNGVSFSKREGYPGCLVFACTTSIPIKFFINQSGQNILVDQGIKCGDYVKVQLNIVGHPGQGTAKPGLYINPNAAQLIGYGPEIVNTPTGDAIFGTTAPTPPPGASATPMSAQPNALLVPTGAPAMPAPVGYPQQPMMPAPTAAPAPHYGVLPAAHQPQAAPAPQYIAPAQPMMPPTGAPAMPAPVGYPQQPAYPQVAPAPVGFPVPR